MIQCIRGKKVGSAIITGLIIFVCGVVVFAIFACLSIAQISDDNAARRFDD